MGSRSPNIWYFSFPWEPIYLGLSFLSDTSFNKPHWDIALCKNINAGWVSNACGQAVWPPEHIFSLRTFWPCKLQILLLWRCRPHKRLLIHGGRVFENDLWGLYLPGLQKIYGSCPQKAPWKFREGIRPRRQRGAVRVTPWKQRKRMVRPGEQLNHQPACIYIYIWKIPCKENAKLKKKKSKQKLS